METNRLIHLPRYLHAICISVFLLILGVIGDHVVDLKEETDVPHVSEEAGSKSKDQKLRRKGKKKNNKRLNIIKNKTLTKHKYWLVIKKRLKKMKLFLNILSK